MTDLSAIPDVRARVGGLCIVAAVALAACSGDADGGPRLGEVSERSRLDRSRELGRRLRREPGNAGAWFRWGVLLLELGRFESAAHKFRKSMNLRPEDPRAALFLGHALYAAGRFGEAYENYRRAAAGGLVLENVLEGARARIGESARNPSEMPGLDGLVEMAAPRERRRLIEVVARFEELGGHGKLSLLAVNRILLVSLAGSGAPPDGVPRRWLLDYCVETGRGARYDSEDALTGALKSPVEFVSRLARLAGDTLRGLEVDTATHDGRPVLALSLDGRESRGAAPGTEDVLALLNRLMEGAGSALRFWSFPVDGEPERWIVCVTTRQAALLERDGGDAADAADRHAVDR